MTPLDLIAWTLAVAVAICVIAVAVMVVVAAIRTLRK